MNAWKELTNVTNFVLIQLGLTLVTVMQDTNLEVMGSLALVRLKCADSLVSS